MKELETLGAETRAQAAGLEAASAQVEAYSSELQRLRALVLEAEQKLRTALAPAKERDAAAREQQVIVILLLDLLLSFQKAPRIYLSQTAA